VEFDEVVEQVGKAVDAVGVGITVLGVVTALLVYGVRLVRRFPVEEAYRSARQGIGRAILLGLEFLVAGDIIRTVAVSPTFRSAGVLALMCSSAPFCPWRSKSRSEGCCHGGAGGMTAGARPMGERNNAPLTATAATW
jgi:uncharacterized membrane protein